MLDTLVGYHLRRASNAVGVDFAQAMAGTGIAQVPFAVVATVAANPGSSQGSVGRALGIKGANMVTLINALVDDGVLERGAAAGDRRAFALRLTEAGHARYIGWVARIKAHERAVFGRLSARERALLIDLLARVGPAQRLEEAA